ncbi:hypothetical protein C7447_10264 [Tenacibaculum adriaticum]|uniref:Lipoprotein n=1 Tax=Tenacibaculum adriaticum TaxID=413713 RepID=A0A5S5DVS6_9FLAO|nr:DUF6452 family protein [Tenacibaculum adriaticum]TYP98749.1 hypothetical protein C7447_10264 [Tenacibaculum adriaticum]
MKKSLFIVFLVIFIVSTSCEKDDFCVQNPVTPSLVIEFYNKDSINKTKAVERFSAVAASKGEDSLFVNLTTSNIALPLNSQTEETIYAFKKNEEDGTKDTNEEATLTIKYTTEEKYVSRSCGYRFIFNDLSFEKTGWIDSLSISELKTINNQDSTHVKIYH